MKELIKLIQECKVTSLSMNNCHIGDWNGVALASGFMEFTCIQHLSARNNDLGDATAS